MLRVVFAQTARVRCTCAGLYLRRKRGRRQQRQHHAADEQYAEYSFLHWLFSSCSYRYYRTTSHSICNRICIAA